MKLSVIIVSYNCKVYLDYCIQSVISSLKNIHGEIIVIDNNSTDNTKDFIRSKGYNITFIESKINLGFSKANNQAVKSAKGEYLFFLNPDTVIPENLFDPFFKGQNDLNNMGILGFRMIDGRGQFLKESKRNSPTKRMVFKKLLGIKNNYYSIINEFDYNSVDILCGANMLISNKVFNQINCFNEEYFMYGEDIELSKKSLLSGFKNYYNGKNTLIHFKGESTDKNIKYLKNFYGAMAIYYKNIFSPSRLNLFTVKFFLRQIINFKSLFINSSSTKSKFEKSFFITDSVNHNVSKNYRNVILKKEIDHSDNECNIILDPNYLTYNEIIEIIGSSNPSNNINFCFLSKDYSYVIESCGMNQKGKVVFL